MALVEFKRKNYGRLPGEGGGYFAKLAEASTLLNQARLDLQEAENARDAIKEQIADEEPTLGSEGGAVVVATNPEVDARILELNKNLDNLRLKYTEQHPDIVSTKRLIAQLEERKKEEAKLVKPTTSTGSATVANPIYQQLTTVLAEAEARAASMRARVAEYAARYDRMKAEINAIPQVEAEYVELMRDYGVYKENYEKLLQRRESAKMSEDVSTTTQMVTFKVVDPPVVPQNPSAPNRILLSSLVFLGALLGGIGIGFLMHLLRPTFQSQGDLWEITGIPVLGTVSMIWTDQQKIKQKKGFYALGFSLLMLLSLYGVVWFKLQQGALPF